jgi:peroxiredoxin
MIETFESEGIRVMAASVDPLEKAKETAEKNSMTFPLGYGLDAAAVSRLTGAFYDRKKHYIHATGFILRPNNTVEVACYSTGTVGRLTAQDTLGLIRFYKSRNKT